MNRMSFARTERETGYSQTPAEGAETVARTLTQPSLRMAFTTLIREAKLILTQYPVSR